MAGRPEKHIVDFFPFFVKDGRTLFILESKFGCKGTGFFTNVMRFLCLTPDHHYCISSAGNADRLFFFSKMHCDEESGNEMLNLMAETGKINKNLWLQKNVIYSEDLINSLSEAYRKRENKPLNLEQIDAIYELKASLIKLIPEEIPIKGGINTQRKEKKRKEEKREHTPAKIKYLDSVYLTADEHLKLREALGQKSLDVGIEKLDYSITVKGGKYKDHYKTLLNWHKRGYMNSAGGNGNGRHTEGGPRIPEYKGDDKPRERGEIPAEIRKLTRGIGEIPAH